MRAKPHGQRAQDCFADRNPKRMNKFFGAVLVAAGVVLLVLGFQARDSMEARMSGVFSSSPRNRVTAMLAGGTACVVAGAAVILTSRR